MKVEEINNLVDLMFNFDFEELKKEKSTLELINKQKQEIDRLNNIINELEKCLEEEIKEGRPKDHLWLMGYYDASKDYLNKLKELKEGK